MKGKVKKVILERGFGFITAEDGKEVFFHRSDCQDVNFEALEEGSSVEFDLEQGQKGPRAVGVKKAEG